MRKAETAIVRKLHKLIRTDGGFVMKVHGSVFQPTGIPDLIGCYHGRFFGIEVKTPGNKPSKIQLFKLKQIRRAGGIAFWGDDAVTMYHELRKKSFDISYYL